MNPIVGLLIVFVLMLNLVFHAYRCGHQRGRDEALARWDAAIAKAKAASQEVAQP